MARQTLHCVDTYLAGARGKLAVKEHRELKTAEEAVGRAERDAEKSGVAGAMAYSIFGRTPEE